MFETQRRIYLTKKITILLKEKDFIFLFLIGLTIGAYAVLFLKVPSSSDTSAPWPTNSSTQSTSEISTATEQINLSTKLFEEVRILCIVLTNPANHQKRAIHIKNTWGRHCNKLIFASTLTDNNLGSIALNVVEDYDHLWGKTKQALQYVYKNFLNDYDWVYKADDDTFAIMENMRYMLSAYSPENPIYFGHKFNTHFHKLGYFSGGAGYVMSREAVRRINEFAFVNGNICRSRDDSAEDWEVGLCFDNVGVYPGDSRDPSNHERFFPFAPASHLFPKRNPKNWYWIRKYYPDNEGLGVCSNYTISFHYITAAYMRVLYFATYHIQPYGIERLHPALPKPRNFTDVALTLIKQKIDLKLW